MLKAIRTLIAVTGLAACAMPMLAHATTEVNKTVKKLGVQGYPQGNNYYVILNEPISLNCLYNTLYIAPQHKDMFAHLLTVKATGLIISRIDISQPGGNGTQCTVDLVELSS